VMFANEAVYMIFRVRTKSHKKKILTKRFMIIRFK
jgi:hypothetical protein